MKLIAHRGLLYGPDKSLENTIAQIEKALSYGFDCEVDVYRIDDQLFLGHDEPQYKISKDFLFNDRMWIHAKNFNALSWLTTQSNLKYFWHDTDKYTLCSNNVIWTCEQKKR